MGRLKNTWNMRTILLDVDYTLYPKGTGPFVAVSRRIEDFLKKKLNLTPEETKALRRIYVNQYGSTLGGLMHDHQVDPQVFLPYVHDVPVEELLMFDERLKQALESIAFDLIAFSNGSHDYIERVLNALGVDHLFADLFTIEEMDFIPKPRLHPYCKVMERYGLYPEEFVVVDDMVDNVVTAIGVGMHAVLVGNEHQGDMVNISDIYTLPYALATFLVRANTGGRE